jgi:hypothetical protein
MENNIEDLVRYQNLKTQLAADLNRTARRKPFQSSYKPTSGFTDITYDVPTSAIYDRLSDGSYIPKFENYQGAFGNEDRLAQQQSGAEQVFTGLSKNLLKVGTYAIDATVGSATGLVNAVKDGSWSSFWDNPVSNYLDDINKKLDNNLANYYTDEQKSMGWLRSMGTVNFWANDFAGALAFVGGALLPEIAIGAMTGGSTLGAGFAKMAARSANSKSLWGVGVKTADKLVEFTRHSAGGSAIKGYYRTVLGETAGNVLSTGAFLARTSGFEAGMEARHNFKESMSTYIEKFQEINGRIPTQQELGDFTKQAVQSANYVFGANMAILGVSNAVMFGKMLNPIAPKLGSTVSGFGKSATNFANRAIGLSYKKELVEEGGKKILKYSMREANKLQKFAGNTYLILSKPAVEGLYEEGLQGVAGGTMQNYLESLYDPSASAGYDFTAALTDALSKQYTTDEGWKEMVIGMMVGFAGGGVSNPKSFAKGEALPGMFKNSRKSRYNEMQEQLDQANSGITALQGLNRTSAMQAAANSIKSGAKDMRAVAYENTFSNFQFIRSQEHLKSTKEMEADFEAVINNSEFDPQLIEEIGLDNVDQYKEQLISEFKTTTKAYNKAKRYADALGLDRVEMPNGEKRQIYDAVVFQLTAGQNALGNAKKIGSMIDQVIGSSGVFDHISYYNNLPQEEKSKLLDLRAKESKLNKLKEQAKSLGEQMAGARPQPGRQFRETTLERRYNAKAEQIAVINQQITQLSEEVGSIQRALQSKYEAANTSFEQIAEGAISGQGALVFGDVTQTIAAINKLDTYLDSLREYGKTEEASQLEYLLEQFKMFSDAHRSAINLQRDMMQTGFFGSKNGKAFVNSLIGEKYEMSEDFKNVLRENNAFIQNSMKYSGLDVRESAVEQVLEEAIAKNPELSEREKYKLESVFRLVLGVEAAKAAVEQIRDQQIVVSREEVNTDPLEGDTVRLAQEAMLKDMDYTNLTAVNDAINAITEQIDIIVDLAQRDPEKFSQLESDLERLKQRKQEIEQEAGVQPAPTTKAETEARKAEIERRKQEELETLISNINIEENRRPNGSIGTQGFTPESILNLAKFINEKLNLSIPLDLFNGESIKPLIEYIKSKPELIQSFSDYVKTDPVEVLYLPDGTIQFEDGNHRANLLNLIGASVIPSIEVSQKSKLDKINAKYDAELKALEEQDDKEDQEGIPSEEREGQEPVQTESDEARSQRKAEASRVLQAQIEEVERQIELAKKPFKIINSEEYVRYNELVNKRLKEELTEQEDAELAELEEDIDRWLLITGAVADGVRLSDLIRQKALLENVKVEEVDTVPDVTPDEVVDDESIFKEDGGNYNSRYGQGYDRVMVSREKKPDGKIVYTLYHLTPRGFTELTGIEEFTRDASGNIVLTQEQVESINANTSLQIVMENKYSPVLIEQQSMKEGEDLVLTPLKSDFNDMEEVSPENAHNITETYNVEQGEELEMVVDPNDAYNMELIEEFKKAVKSLESLMTEEQFEDHIENEVAVAQSKDAQLKRLRKEYDELAEKRRTATTTQSAKLSKDMTKIAEKIAKREDAVRESTTKRLEKNREKGVDQKKLLEAKDKLKKNLKVHFARENGAVVSTAKAYREGVKKSAQDAIFDSVRSSIVDTESNMVEFLMGNRIPVRITNTAGETYQPRVKVASTLLGHVNFTYSRLDDGRVVNTKNTVNPEQASKIVDIGYVEGGKVVTRSGQGVRESFLRKAKERQGKSPFVVVQVGAHKVAIPVEVAKRQLDQEDLDNFQSMWESKIPMTDKVIRMNEFLASKGVDVKREGFSTLNPETLTNQFFNDKLAQVKEKNYFYSVNEWLNKDGKSIEDIATEQVIVNFDLNNPLHSPKIVFDYSDINVVQTSFSTSQDVKDDATDKANTKNSKFASDLIAKEVDKGKCKN